MSVEYAPKGLIGLLTPQANTTVEPEMADRLIFMTGGTFSEGANEYLSDCANVLITKPIGRAELTEAIHRTLGLRAA